MKISCPRNVLSNAFGIVSAVVPSRTTKDILKNVKVIVENNQVTLQATDTEIGISYTLADMDTKSAGEFLLPVARVGNILREIVGDEIHLDIADQELTLTCGSSKFRLPVESAGDFPDIPHVEEGLRIRIEGGVLKKMIRRTIFAIDDENTRYALGGVLFEVSEEGLTCVSTDGRRMAMTSVNCSVEGKLEKGVRPVVPRKALQLIEKSASDAEVLEIIIHANEIMVKGDAKLIYARLIEGRFPNYKDVIPQSANSTVDLVTSTFFSAVRQSQILTNEETRGVDFTFSDGKLILSSKAADMGESTIELPITFEDKEVVIRFDPRYMTDYLRVLESGDNIQLKLITGDDPAIFRVSEDYTYVMMPLSR